MPRHVAGGPEESIVQPTWAPDGSPRLHLRPHRLVEPLPLASRRRGHRGAGAHGGGVRRATVGLRSLRLRHRCRRHHRGGSVIDGSAAAPRHPPGRVAHGAARGARTRSRMSASATASSLVSAARRLDRRPSCASTCAPGATSAFASPATSRSSRPTCHDPRHIAFPTSGGRTAYAWYYPPTELASRGPAR